MLRKRKEADDTASAKNCVLAEIVAKLFKVEKLEVSLKDLEFEFVCKCEEDTKFPNGVDSDGVRRRATTTRATATRTTTTRATTKTMW